MTDPACESLFLFLQRLGRLKRRRSDSVREPDILALKLVTHSKVSNLSNNTVHTSNRTQTVEKPDISAHLSVRKLSFFRQTQLSQSK